ncbi:MAG: [protein-PII] uridylyltransferase [Mariprofundaceae bacterium]
MTEAKQQLQKLYAEIGDMFNAGEEGGVLVRRMCEGVDRLLTDLWRQKAPQACHVVDLVAVGGYGRGELAPYSDWDLWFLVPDDMTSEVEEDIQAFLYALWDMNVKIGHAVRSVKDTISHVREDWDSATAAMESRLLHGEGVVYAAMQTKLAGFFKRRRKAFVEAKLAELEARHTRAGGTAFLMEPDIKDGKGSLRDVQAVFWMAKAWYGSQDMDDLVEKDAISAAEQEHLLAAQNFLWRCRCGLHLEVKRASDRLGFEQQAELARRMHYEDSEHKPAVDAFMKDFFRYAGRVARVSGMLCMYFQEQLHPKRFAIRRDIGDGLTLVGQHVGVRDEQVFVEDPLRLLRIFHVAQQGHRRLSSGALRQVRANVLIIDDAFRANPEAHRIFLTILREPRNVAWALKEMNDTGVLGRFIPEFRHAVGLGQFNRYHAYTVDEHTIRAVGEARNMSHRDREERLPLAHQVIQKIRRVELLYIALLFHDIAKGMPGDHSENGERLARGFCQRIGLNQDSTDLIGWLVREHLTMAITSQRFDLDDPSVIAHFAERVGDVGRLNYLLCLTVADIAAVGPNVWNDWKGSLLRGLYLATERVLMGEVERGEELEQQIRVRKQSALAKTEGDAQALRRAMEILPWRGIMHFPPYQLRIVVELLAQVEAGTGVSIRVDQIRSETMVSIVADEWGGMFAALAAAISSGHANIVAAHAYELLDGRVLDVFHIQGAEGKAMDVDSDLHRLQQRIENVLAEKSSEAFSFPACKVNTLMRQVHISVRELSYASSRQTAIEITAADRPGLLAQLAYAIHQQGLNIRGAAITTFGEKAVDVFFLQSKEGDLLPTAEKEALCAHLKDVAHLPEE